MNVEVSHFQCGKCRVVLTIAKGVTTDVEMLPPIRCLKEVGGCGRTIPETYFVKLKEATA